MKEKKTRTNKRTYFFKQKHKQKLKKKLAMRHKFYKYPVLNVDVHYWKDFPNHPWRKVEKHREIIRVRRACCLTDLQNIDIENFLIPIPRRFL